MADEDSDKIRLYTALTKDGPFDWAKAKLTGPVVILYRPGQEDVDITEVVQRLEGEEKRLREMVAGSHALRCTCGDHQRWNAEEGRWDIRDVRCIEQQAMAVPTRPGGGGGA